MESRDTRAKSFDVVGRRLGDRRASRCSSTRWSTPTTRAGARRRRSGCGAGALALLAFFVAWERRAARPLVPFSIFRLRTLRGSNAAGLLIGASLFSMFFFISLYLQQVLGYDALKAGLAYLPLAVLDHRQRRRRLAAGDPDRLQADAA